MKFLSTLFINLKKLRYRTGKALFLVLPVTILVALSTIISSQVKNIQSALEKNVFSEIAEESTLLTLEYQAEVADMGGQSFTEKPTDSQYTEIDLQKIRSIENVEDASINYTVPISNVKTTDLFEGKTLSFKNFVALSSTMASSYTSDDFTYTEGSTVIPIVLNSNQFKDSYEDWGGKTEIAMSFSSARNSDPSTIQDSSPIKSSAIEYDRDTLIGTEFQMTFGGFSTIADYKITQGSDGPTFTKLSDDEIAELESAREDAVSKYWDYSVLSEGVTYTFKVVGIIESQDDTSIYIPEKFAQKLMSDYISKQLSARNSADIDIDDLDSTYTGTKFDGTQLISSMFTGSGRFGGGMMPMGRPSSGGQKNFSISVSTTTSATSSYEIPGLIIQTEDGDDNATEIVGSYTDTDVFSSATKSGTVINVKINSIGNRTGVIEALNDSGYAYQDSDELEVFNNVENTLNSVSSGVIIGFIALTIAVIVLTMSKFVSDGTKEIGIFRAVGFTKGNILAIFLVQAILYVATGYIIGLGIGFIGNFLISNITALWFDNFVSTTVAETFAVVADVDNGIFRNFDLSAVGMLSMILFGITLVISFIPAYKASTISPVEAIKSE